MMNIRHIFKRKLTIIFYLICPNYKVHNSHFKYHKYYAKTFNSIITALKNNYISTMAMNKLQL